MNPDLKTTPEVTVSSGSGSGTGSRKEDPSKPTNTTPELKGSARQEPSQDQTKKEEPQGDDKGKPKPPPPEPKVIPPLRHEPPPVVLSPSVVEEPQVNPKKGEEDENDEYDEDSDDDDDYRQRKFSALKTKLVDEYRNRKAAERDRELQDLDQINQDRRQADQVGDDEENGTGFEFGRDSVPRDQGMVSTTGTGNDDIMDGEDGGQIIQDEDDNPALPGVGGFDTNPDSYLDIPRTKGYVPDASSPADLAAGQSSPSKTEKMVNMGLGYAQDLLNMNSIGTGIINQKINDETDTDKKEEIRENNEGATRAMGALSMISGGIGLYTNINNIYNLAKKRRNSHNKRAIYEMTTSALSSTYGTFGSLGKIASGGITTFGDPKNTNQKAASTALGIFNSMIGTAANISGLVGGYVDQYQRYKLRKKLETQSGIASAIDEDALKQDVDDSKDGDRREYLGKKRMLRSLKAKKYALQDAAEFHKIKNNQFRKNWIGSITSSLGTASTFFQVFNPKSSASGFLKAWTPLMTSLGGFANRLVGHISDQSTGKKIKEKKLDVINRYLINKRNKLRDEVDEESDPSKPDHNYFENVDDNTLDRITIARLGVDIPINDDGLGEDELMEGFKALNMKRARNIMEASPKDRETMLSALGLTQDATLNEIASALTGDA